MESLNRAKKRLIFEEFFLFQIGIGLQRCKNTRQEKLHAYEKLSCRIAFKGTTLPIDLSTRESLAGN
ncbi:hypothetical protein N752_12880 [Desulforamulus aquiferis]|nr:hypothetical protein N752_12880 [Desulforamulus aquiferis]